MRVEERKQAKKIPVRVLLVIQSIPLHFGKTVFIKCYE